MGLDGNDLGDGPGPGAALRPGDESGAVGMGKSGGSPPGSHAGSATSASSSRRPSCRCLQKDALERLDLRQMLKQPELLEAVEPDVHLVANLLSLRSVLPPRGTETARAVVRTVVDQLEKPTGRAAAPGGDRAASTGPRATAARATTRSTGTARSGRT